MKSRNGDSSNVGEGSRGAADFMKKKKRRLGGKGLSLEAFVGANKSKPVVTASQIRKQREVYQNAKKVQKYRKTLKQLTEEGHQFEPRVHLPLPPVDAEILGEAELVGEDRGEPNPSAGERWPPASGADRSSGEKDQKGRGNKFTKARGPSHLEKLREEYERKKQEEEADRKERREAFAKQQVARDKSKHERKEVQNKLRKVTRKGQPVMKHRMEHLLDTLERQLKD